MTSADGSRGIGDPVLPRYGTADVGLVLPDAIAAVRGEPPRVLPLPEGLRAVVVLVVDGLGRRLLTRHAEVAPLLAAAPGPTLDAPFPTTTATSLTTIGTGVSPGRHGIVGYSLAVPGDDRRLVTLTWSWEQHDPAYDARPEVVPERFQPVPTVFERASALGVAAVTVIRPEFAGSGLTRAALRGGRVVTAIGLPDTLTAALLAAGEGGPTVVYAHHGALDATGHAEGPSSEQWLTELAAIDGMLGRAMEELPPDVAIVVTADHGMVHVLPDRFVELADRPELLAGVRLLAGEGRARQLHSHPGAAEDVLAAWRDICGQDAHVVSRDEAIGSGWFGPVVADHVRGRVGDVVVSAVSDISWVHRDQDLLGGRLTGLHGALTPEEVEVPALVLHNAGTRRSAT